LAVAKIEPSNLFPICFIVETLVLVAVSQSPFAFNYPADFKNQQSMYMSINVKKFQ